MSTTASSNEHTTGDGTAVPSGGVRAATRPTSCDGCCACCMHAHEPPFAGVNGVPAGDDLNWDALPESLRSEIVDFRMNIRPQSSHDQPCIWLNLATKRCRHYEYRPSLCRTFELGGEDCLGFRMLHMPIVIVPKTSPSEWEP